MVINGPFLYNQTFLFGLNIVVQLTWTVHWIPARVSWRGCGVQHVHCHLLSFVDFVECTFATEFLIPTCSANCKHMTLCNFMLQSKIIQGLSHCCSPEVQNLYYWCLNACKITLVYHIIQCKTLKTFPHQNEAQMFRCGHSLLHEVPVSQVTVLCLLLYCFQTRIRSKYKELTMLVGVPLCREQFHGLWRENNKQNLLNTKHRYMSTCS